MAVDSGLKCVKARGTFVNIALWGASRVALDMTVMLFGERKYIAGEPCLVYQTRRGKLANECGASRNVH